MIRIRLTPTGGAEIERTIEGDSAWIGRDESCDVVIKDPHISKRHLLVVHGLVVFDKSSNGSFVDGKRISEPTVLKGGQLTLGRDRIEVRIESEGEPDATLLPGSGGSRGELVELRAQLEQERRRGLKLDLELAQARQHAGVALSGGDERAQRLQVENEDLRRRLSTLKAQVEEREESAAASLQARLATEQLGEVQAQNQRLAAQLRELEARSRAASAGGPGAELAEVLRQKDAELARLRAELEAARSQGGGSPSELFESLQRQIRELRTKVAQYESGDSRAGLPASDLFFRLQSENRDLRNRLQALEGAAVRGVALPEHGPPAQQVQPAAGDASELAAARLEVQRLEREVRLLRSSAAPAAGQARVPSGVIPILRSLIEQDAEALKPSLIGPPEDFVVLESLRSMRSLERVVTRFAGAYIQLYNTHTQLPGIQGNLRTYLRAILERTEDPAPREELLKYVKELGSWLIVALGAPRKAAEDFALELKLELSEEGLTRERAIGGMKMLSAQREAELWRRACAYWKEQSSDVLQDRIETLTRKHALELRGSA